MSAPKKTDADIAAENELKEETVNKYQAAAEVANRNPLFLETFYFGNSD
jgi:hypothetical protein